MALRVLCATVPMVLSSACSSWGDWRMERDVQRARADAAERIDVEKCSAEGGYVEGVGIFGLPACIKPYADAGNACSDESDCEGLCIVDAEIPVGSKALGHCQKSDYDSFGCFNKVVAGIVEAGICQD